MEWIPVEEFLPEDGQAVLVYVGMPESPAGETDIGSYDEGEFTSAHYTGNITHWMSLPPEPLGNLISKLHVVGRRDYLVNRLMSAVEKAEQSIEQFRKASELLACLSLNASDELELLADVFYFEPKENMPVMPVRNFSLKEKPVINFAYRRRPVNNLRIRNTLKSTKPWR